MASRTTQEKKKLIARLNRINGQIEAVKKLIENDKQCIDILRLLNSTSGALRGVWTTLLNNHLKTCICDTLKQNDTHLVDELIEHFKHLK